jgi:hypothetical protein
LGAVVMTALTILVLAASVIDSRDRVRRDYATSDAALRDWYDSRYGRRGNQLTRENIEGALKRARGFRRWGPIALSGGTALAVIVVAVVATTAIPDLRIVWHAPERITEVIPVENLVETGVVLALLPVLIVEGILAALYVAELDICRLERLLKMCD